MELLKPSESNLPLYVAALERELDEGHEPFRNSLEIIEGAKKDPSALIATFDDPVGGRLITVDAGMQRAALPSFTRWLYDGEICGSIQFRWKPGTVELPPYCLGHIGYQIFPWKRGQGLATKQLELMLGLTRNIELPYVELTTTLANVASQKVIRKNGGVFIKEFERAAEYGGGMYNLFRIDQS